MISHFKRVVDDPSHPRYGRLRAAFVGAVEPRRQAPATKSAKKVGANDPCSCGSGKKYKRCCRP